LLLGRHQFCFCFEKGFFGRGVDGMEIRGDEPDGGRRREKGRVGH